MLRKKPDMAASIRIKGGLFSPSLALWLSFVGPYRTIFIQPDQQVQALVAAITAIGHGGKQIITPPPRLSLKERQQNNF